ncbi:hypothetical protein [Pseudodesulfovibrio sp. zrk46]|uniref:hypothetical protein n=1 Tax=Pseudodesulfovibrio sp. zrk46 TaxID=2725288 RepID=UPI001449EA57|nr:hypothetical protein [Pseudodesulfovibrio sp. zrk46]QJB58305.1 hypothetical protein HFN16_18810 [Pseudodesulfovibrio sp. zrk46]
MTRQSSYSKLRNEMMHGFREKMHKAESTEDVKKFYSMTMYRLFDRLVGKGEHVSLEDVQLNPSERCGYVLTDTLRERPLFQFAWNESDLPYILDDFTKMALNRYTHLSKNTAKTRSKIHHNDGKR